MPPRCTVYLTRSAGAVTPKRLLAGVTAADLATIAEGYVVADNQIEDALGQLRIANLHARGFRSYRLSYRDDGLRQIDIDRWTGKQAAGEIAEVVENLAPAERFTRKVRAHLEACADTVAAWYGDLSGEAMAPVLASEVCRWLAEQFGGLVRGPDDDRYDLDRRGNLRPLT